MTATLYADDVTYRRAPSQVGTPRGGGRGITPRTMSALVASSVIAALCVLGVVLSGGHAEATAVNATLQNFAFSPATLTVHVGDTVTWTNLDTAPHTVTSLSGPTQVSSPTMNKGDKFSYTFTKPGTYKLYCSIHPNMTETVVVEGAATAPGATSGSSPATTAPAMGDMGGMGGMGGMGSSSGGGGGAMTPATTPPSSSSGSTTHPSSGSTTPAAAPAASTCSNTMLVNAMLNPFIVHLDKAHLETSPGDQVAALMNVDNYVLLHTVLVEDMIMPLITAIQNSLNGIDPFITHLDKAHLETSPGNQVAALLNVDSYAQLHTVLVEDMLSPLTESVTGTYGC